MKYPEGCFADALNTIKYLCDAAYSMQYCANETLSSELRKLVKEAIFSFAVVHVHYKHKWREVDVIVENYKKGLEFLDKCGWLIGSGEHKAPTALSEVLSALYDIAKDNLIYVERLQ